MNDETSIQEKH